jgi:hypothetical protein
MKYILAFLAIVGFCAALTGAFIYAIDTDFADRVVFSQMYE